MHCKGFLFKIRYSAYLIVCITVLFIIIINAYLHFHLQFSFCFSRFIK